MRQLPGKKTDLKDSQWIARLLRWGLLKPSLIPPKPIRELRDLCRYRKKLIEQVTAEKNRVQKELEDAGIKLGNVVNDLFGTSGRAMLEALLNEGKSPEEIASLAKGKLRQKVPQLLEALEGEVSEHHRFLIQMHLEHIAFLEEKVAEIDRRIEEKAKPYEEEVEIIRTSLALTTFQQGMFLQR